MPTQFLCRIMYLSWGMTADQLCPCGTGNMYSNCCAPFHAGTAFPPTALQLMRSRYSAYALKKVDYLLETVVRDRVGDYPPASVRDFAMSTDWRRLDILGTDAGELGDSQGVVEFQAWYLQGNRLDCIRENSLFFVEDGRWNYSHGSHSKPKIGRNDPCPCGSGKKYKKCHG